MGRFLLLKILFICAIAHNSTVLAINNVAQNQYSFKYLTVDQGLSNNNIRSFCQDSKGFIWIGTQNGLNKYNGQTNVTYGYDSRDSNSLSSNKIDEVFFDSKNNLWIASEGGLDLYNVDLDNFTRFNHADISWPLGHIYAIVEDKMGILWFGGTTGLYAYNLNTNEIKYYSNKPDNDFGIPSDLIYRLLVDKNNNLWISVMNEGVYVFNQEDEEFKGFFYESDDLTTISATRVERMYEDKAGNIWLGTLNSGLYKLVPGGNKFKQIIPDVTNSYSTRVRAIFEDLRGDFFIGTRGGLYRFNKNTKSFERYAYEGHNFSDLSQNSIRQSFIDKTGTLWLGTFSGGVNYCNLNKKEFVHYIAGKNDNHYLSGSNIYCIVEDSKENLWIGGDNGLNYLDRETYTFKYFKHDPQNPNSISYNDIKALVIDSMDNLWIATNRGGLNYYNVKTNQFIAFKHNPEDENSIGGDKIYCLMNDKDENLWIIYSKVNDIEYLNIDILPKGSEKFIHLKETSYFGLDADSVGDVYFGGVNGFTIFSTKDSTFNFIRNEFFIGNVNTIRLDSKGIVWIGSTKGLTRYDKKLNSFLWFSEANGYPISEVFGILEDSTNNLWVSTNTGLVKISNIVKKIGDNKFRVYDHNDGLQSKQFNYNSFYRCKSGEMVFGGINGFNTFFPERIIDDTVTADVIITDLKIYNKSVPIGKKVGGRVILEKSITVTEAIKLGYRQNVFTLEFASPQNANPEKHIFKIKLDGFDKDWQYRKAGNNTVSYINLPSGKYTFMVSAANNDDVWSTKPVTLAIDVVPPIWKTWWFILIAVLIGGIFIYALLKSRIEQFKIREELLKQAVDERTIDLNNSNKALQLQKFEILEKNKEIEKHRNYLEDIVAERTKNLEIAKNKAEESDKLKSSFLANMSHEIRTPLNAIIGFTELLGDESLDKVDASDYRKIIENSGMALLQLIDDVVDFSKIEAGQLVIFKTNQEIQGLLSNVFVTFKEQYKDSQVKLLLNNCIDFDLHVNTDGIRLTQILNNLVGNAFKFTKKGKIQFGIKQYTQGKEIVFYIADTGVGINEKHFNTIFNRFVKIDEDTTTLYRGVGLGLAITKHLVEQLGGKIWVNSEIGKGSEFVFTMPCDDITV